jgi:amino-acid N-acetyltransferase
LVTVLRPATEADTNDIRRLLEREGLPTSDLASAQPEFIVACEGDEIIGIGALQRFEATALLRSVAVDARRRHAGIGRSLVMALERHARDQGVTELVLLTQTAARFFEEQGYCIVDRQSAPAAVQLSEEFRSLCPASAVCMSKALAQAWRA